MREGGAPPDGGMAGHVTQRRGWLGGAAGTSESSREGLSRGLLGAHRLQLVPVVLQHLLGVSVGLGHQQLCFLWRKGADLSRERTADCRLHARHQQPVPTRVQERHQHPPLHPPLPLATSSGLLLTPILGHPWPEACPLQPLTPCWLRLGVLLPSAVPTAAAQAAAAGATHTLLAAAGGSPALGCAHRSCTSCSSWSWPPTDLPTTWPSHRPQDGGRWLLPSVHDTLPRSTKETCSAGQVTAALRRREPDSGLQQGLGQRGPPEWTAGHLQQPQAPHLMRAGVWQRGLSRLTWSIIC